MCYAPLVARDPAYPPRLGPPWLGGLAARLHNLVLVRQELSDVSHALLTTASDLERENRPVTTRDLARVARLCGRLGLVLLTHSQMRGLEDE